MKNCIFIIAIAFLFVCCGKKINTDYRIENSVFIENNTVENKILFSTVFDSMKYVVLETSDSVLIKETTKVKLYKNTVYVLDKMTKTLFAFDLNGKLKWKIDKYGNGPQEYTQLFDFDISEENDVLYLFSRYEKIQQYTLNGKFIDEYPLHLAGISFAINDNQMYIYSGGRPNQINGKDVKCNLLTINEKKEIIPEIPFEYDLKSVMIYNHPNAFCKTDNELRFFYPFSTNIYSINKDSVYVKYHFNFGKYNMPENYLTEHTMDELEKSSYAYALNSYWENQHYCNFVITSNQVTSDILYDKKENKAYQCSFYDDIAYCFPVFFQATNDYLVSARNAEDLYQEYNFSPAERKGTVLEKVISEINEDDNPVIFIYYFK